MPRSGETGFVYAVTEVDGEKTKIGCTCHPMSQRFASLQRETKKPLFLVAAVAVDAPFLVEEFLHKHFQSRHCHGEWFVLSEDILASFAETVRDIVATLPTMPGISFGERLFWQRCSRQMTQKQLASLTGLNTNTIARLEQRDLKDLMSAAVARIARVLDCRSDYLLGLIDNPHEPIRTSLCPVPQ